MSTIDNALKSFDSYIAEYDSYSYKSMSESDTRCKFIDKIFKDILGWSEDNIEREGHNVNGYFDYLFCIPGFKFIVEAKRNSFELTLPNTGNQCTLKTLLTSNVNKEVITQIRNYIIEEGLQYGVITNGNQFIIGRFNNTDGTKWQTNSCFVFRSLSDIKMRFIDFYNTLSIDGVINNGGFDIYDDVLLGGETIVSRLGQKNTEMIRNSLSDQLQPILNNVFSDIYRDDTISPIDIIKECFVESKDSQKNINEIQSLFSDIPPQMSEISQAKNTGDITTQINKHLTKSVNTPAAPIILIGSKGAGKTTFIHYLFKKALSNEVRRNKPFIYIDFRKYYNNRNINFSTIYEDAIDILIKDYEDIDISSLEALNEIYSTEIYRKSNGAWKNLKKTNLQEYNSKHATFLEARQNDAEKHFYKVSEYLLRELCKRLCVIIDNADQFDLETQQSVFLFAQNLYERGGCNVVISLREGYFYKFRNKPPFDAFRTNGYHIIAPEYGDILRKRIDYALKHKPKIKSVKGTIDSGFNVIVQPETIERLFHLIDKALFGKNDVGILKFLYHTTYPNIREGLELFNHFLVSGHTKVDEYVFRYTSINDRPVPIWEFIKSVALDNKKYYDHTISRIHNLFQPATGCRKHFLKIRILKYFIQNLRYHTRREDRFRMTSDIVELFTSGGYKLNEVLAELNLLLSYQLIETADYASDRIHTVDDIERTEIGISWKGNYYVEELMGQFTYYDIILQDTLIFNHDDFNKIYTQFPEYDDKNTRDLKRRIDSVAYFLEYLSKQEREERFSKQEYKSNNIIKDIQQRVNADIKRINRRQNSQK